MRDLPNHLSFIYPPKAAYHKGESCLNSLQTPTILATFITSMIYLVRAVTSSTYLHNNDMPFINHPPSQMIKIMDSIEQGEENRYTNRHCTQLLVSYYLCTVRVINPAKFDVQNQSCATLCFSCQAVSFALHYHLFKTSNLFSPVFCTVIY